MRCESFAVMSSSHVHLGSHRRSKHANAKICNGLVSNSAALAFRACRRCYRGIGTHPLGANQRHPCIPFSSISPCPSHAPPGNSCKTERENECIWICTDINDDHDNGSGNKPDQIKQASDEAVVDRKRFQGHGDHMDFFQNNFYLNGFVVKEVRRGRTYRRGRGARG